MATRDEGLDKFEGFLALLGQTRSDFQQQSEAIDRLGDALNEKDEAAETQLADFTKTVEGFTEGFGASQLETIGSLDKMIETLGDLVEDRLGDAIKTINEIEEEVEKAVDTFSSALQSGFDDLEEEGYGAAGSAVDDLEELVGNLKEEAEEQFGNLEEALEGFRREAEAARNATVDVFEDVADEVKDTLTSAVDTGFETFTGGLNAGAQLLEGGLGNLNDLFDAGFTGFQNAAEQIGEMVMDTGKQILGDAQQHVQDELLNTMSDAFSNMVEEVVAGLIEEIVESTVMMTAGSAITTAIGSFVPALVAAKAIVGTINDLLEILDGPF
jgi:hypothetical protein